MSIETLRLLILRRQASLQNIPERPEALGLVQAALTARMEKKADAKRAAPAAAPPIRKDFLRFDINWG